MPTRGEIIRQLSLLSLTENERALMDHGLKTRRQVLEETFWYKFAYHCFRELGSNRCTLHPAIDETSGAFMVTGTAAQIFRRTGKNRHSKKPGPRLSRHACD